MNRIWIPTLVSTGNIVCGFVAIVHQFQGHVENTMWWMFAAVLFDAFDGVVATKLNAKSELGAKLDGFSDVVSFAMLPGFVLYQFFHTTPTPNLWTEVIAWGAGVGYSIAGIFRELRFLSIPPEKRSRKGFTGLPIAPPASLIVALVTLNAIQPGLLPSFGMQLLVLSVAVLGAYLMTLSHVEYLRWRGKGIGWQVLGAAGFGVWGWLALGNIHGAGAAFFTAFSAIYYFGTLVYHGYRRVSQR
ncbi:MAG: hypothetical protein Fur0022_16530 [Anaerolineales bacterium]